MLNKINVELLKPNNRDQRWNDSPFLDVYNMIPKSRGAVWEKVIADLFVQSGAEVSTKTPTTDYDLIVDGRRVEVKGSMCSKNADSFSFLQLRPDQEYDEVLFVCVYPHDFKVFRMDKQTVIANCNNGVFGKQHGGKKAESRTFCTHPTAEGLIEMGATEVVL